MVVEALKFNGSLKMLELISNNISDVGVEALVGALRVNEAVNVQW